MADILIKPFVLHQFPAYTFEVFQKQIVGAMVAFKVLLVVLEILPGNHSSH
jgi:hypothetical protein